MRRFAIVAGMLFVATFAIAQPKPEVSEYLKTRWGGAVTDTVKEPGTAYFGLTLDWVRRPPAEAVVVAEFENTEDGTKPYIVEQAVNLVDSPFVLKSPKYPCVVNNSRYNVTIRIFSDASKSVLLGTHEQQILFGLPIRHLKALKLRECGAP
jgi:hypothetical protein